MYLCIKPSYNIDTNTKIVGRGMIAKGLEGTDSKMSNVLIFASGVSNSLCADQKEYDREYEMLCKSILECKVNNQKIVYFSSAGAVYGDYEAVKDEQSPLFPQTMYGKYKVLAESVIINSGIEYLILRLPNVVGPKQNKNQLFSALVLQAIKGEVHLYKNAGRDFIDVDDVCDILMQLLEKKINNQIIIVASGWCTPITHVFSEIQLVTKTNAIINFVDKGERQVFSTKKLQNLLPDMIKFKPNYYRELIHKYVPIIRSEIDVQP